MVARPIPDNSAPRYEPALTPDKLDFVARVIADARRAVFDRYDADNDDRWCRGCRAHTWVRRSMTKSAKDVGWLSIVSPGLDFVFAIDGLPIRFYRVEDAETATPQRHKAKSPAEVMQYELFEDASVGQPEYSRGSAVWRLRVESVGDSAVDRIVLELHPHRHAEPVTWDIPVSVRDGKRSEPGGVELPSLKIRRRPSQARDVVGED